MSFSSGQQPELRNYVALSWAAHCMAVGIHSSAGRCKGMKKGKRCGSCDFCVWYGDALEGATGHRSSTVCNAGRDYDFFMRDLEVIHGQSIKWQMKAFQGDAVRMLHEIRVVSAECELDEDYLRGVAMRMLQTEAIPELHTLSREVLIRILGEVKRFVRRKLKRELPATAEDARPPAITKLPSMKLNEEAPVYRARGAGAEMDVPF